MEIFFISSDAMKKFHPEDCDRIYNAAHPTDPKAWKKFNQCRDNNLHGEWAARAGR